jgi:hypothetical protein
MGFVIHIYGMQYRAFHKMPYYRFQAWVGTLLRGVHDREPGLPAISMRHEGDWLLTDLIYQQYHHLAVTLVSTVMRARAYYLNMAGNLQVKGAHHRQTCPTHLGC